MHKSKSHEKFHCFIYFNDHKKVCIFCDCCQLFHSCSFLLTFTLLHKCRICSLFNILFLCFVNLHLICFYYSLYCFFKNHQESSSSSPFSLSLQSGVATAYHHSPHLSVFNIRFLHTNFLHIFLYCI